MSELLTIHLSNQSEKPIPWMVWSPEQEQVIASGEADNLMQISTYAKDREVVILADCASVNLMSVPIPPGSARQLENVLPFLLEDELAQDVLQVHVCLLEKNENIANVAVIEHKVMQGWIMSLYQAGITARRIIPDCLCLPLHDGAYSAANLNDCWIIRTGSGSGFAAEEAWLPTMLKSISEQTGKPPSVMSYSPFPANADNYWKAKPAELVMELLSRGIKDNNFTLLSGRYKPSNQFSKHLKYWKEVGIAAFLLFTTLGVEQIIQIERMERQAKELNSKVMQQAKSVLPNNQRIPSTSYLRRVLETELSRLSGGANSQTSILFLLSKIGPALKTSANIQMQTLRYDASKNEIRFDAVGKDFDDFEKLRSTFSQEFNTELGQVNKGKNNIVTGAFVLKRD